LVYFSIHKRFNNGWVHNKNMQIYSREQTQHMVNTIQKLLNRVLFDHPPDSILCVGDRVADALSEFLSAHPQCRVCEVQVPQINAVQREPGTALNWKSTNDIFDFGIVANVIEHTDKNDAIQLLARLRDLYTKKLLVVAPMGKQWENHQSLWQETDLLSLGFILKTKLQVAEKPVCVYAFDISTYKTTPDWLNSRYWANPELWDKYWW
jgi:hypothetical protein